MSTIDWDVIAPTLQEAERDAFELREITEPSCPPHLTHGPDLFCPEASICELCNLTICPEHSDEFTTCSDDQTLHHLDCAADCEYCVDDAREAAMWREEDW